MKKSQYGPCGLYCGACGATDCGGCLSEFINGYVQQCKFRCCSQEKELEFCCYCNEFPCAELHGFMNDEWPHHWTIASNLEFIKKHGKQAWLLVQEKEWSCKSCGAEVKWYQNLCSCGQELDAWYVPT